MTTPKDVLALAKEAGAQIVDFRFCDLPGLMQHFSVPIERARRDLVRGRVRVRRLVDPRLPGDPGVRHAPGPRPRGRVHRPVPPASHAGPQLLRQGPGHDRVYSPRPALRREEGRGATSSRRGSRRPRTGARSASSTSSTRSGSTRTSTRATTTSTPSRACGTPAPRRAATTSATSPGTRRATSPCPPWTTTRTCAARWCSTSEGRHHGRGPAPRGRHGRPGGDRHPLRHAAEDRGQRHEVQVRRQADGAPGGQDGDVHAEADLPGQRLGHAHPPEPVERRREPVLGRGRVRADLATSAGTTSAACWPTRRRCWRSARRPRTRTAGWCRATRRRSTSCTPSGTGARASGSRCSSSRRRPSGWSSARRTRRPTRTWRSARCCWPASTA